MSVKRMPYFLKFFNPNRFTELWIFGIKELAPEVSFIFIYTWWWTQPGVLLVSFFWNFPSTLTHLFDNATVQSERCFPGLSLDACLFTHSVSGSTFLWSRFQFRKTCWAHNEMISIHSSCVSPLQGFSWAHFRGLCYLCAHFHSTCWIFTTLDSSVALNTAHTTVRSDEIICRAIKTRSSCSIKLWIMLLCHMQSLISLILIIIQF